MIEILRRRHAPSPDQREPSPHRLTVDDYYKMAEVGILRKEDRVELIEGEIVDMAPIGTDHDGTTTRLTRLFARTVVDGVATLRVQGGLRLDADNEPQPDVMLLRFRDDDYKKQHPTAADVLLLVEVSGTSLRYDRGRKLALYARFGVPEVWVVDIVGSAVEVYRHPENGTYAQWTRLSEGTLVPALAAGVTIDVAALLA